MAVLLASAVMGPVAVVLLAAIEVQPSPPQILLGAVWLLDVPLTLTWVLFFGLFPDGHRPVKWWYAAVAFAVAAHAAIAAVAWATAPLGSTPPSQGHLPGALVSSAGSTIHLASARTSSALTGLLPLRPDFSCCGAIGCRGRSFVSRSAWGPLRCSPPSCSSSRCSRCRLQLLAGPGDRLIAAVGIGLLGVAAALLRWRLWIVDQALPRAVVLSACSAGVTAVIVAVAVLATGGVGTTQVQGAVLLAVLVSVLVQATAAAWSRGCVGSCTASGPAASRSCRSRRWAHRMDTETAAARIADAARRGLSAPWAALWFPTARPRILRLAAQSGEGTAAVVVHWDVDPDDRERRPSARPRRGSPPASRGHGCVAVLSGDAGPWALLAVGQRRGEPLTIGDLELLDAITREASLAHVNRRLVDEVASSVQELQARAVQLQQSRQRLVAAQDEERRRIERDLHDGAQHDFVALAARLRQLAKGPPVPREVLEGLADEAEQAVFSLQDLARGIYPSVLTDRGVEAATRSYIGDFRRRGAARVT